MDDSHHIPLLFYVFAIVAMAFFFYNLRILWTVRVGKEEKDRSTDWLGRIINALTFGVGQRRVTNRRFAYASIMHFCISMARPSPREPLDWSRPRENCSIFTRMSMCSSLTVASRRTAIACRHSAT